MMELIGKVFINKKNIRVNESINLDTIYLNQILNVLILRKKIILLLLFVLEIKILVNVI